MGNPKFGPVSVVFSPAYVADLTLMLPVDSGLWEVIAFMKSKHTTCVCAPRADMEVVGACRVRAIGPATGAIG